MKIAVAAEGQNVSEHFGHCEGFMIFETTEAGIMGTTMVESPEHQPGLLPNFLADMGVQVIIAGGMGAGAVNIFNEKKIQVITGASGDACQSVESYLAGKLASDVSICEKHEHQGECGGH